MAATLNNKVTSFREISNVVAERSLSEVQNKIKVSQNYERKQDIRQGKNYEFSGRKITNKWFERQVSWKADERKTDFS